ncbi:MAG: site-specific DNA-methyltransferase [Dehalococcoidia bacterium]|nr:site-specific DNA-methyltransferase [Dehalococcoidia bacterium]
MSFALTKQIFKHAMSESWIKTGDVVVDPFGGIGSTGIVGASLGLRVVCVELESEFYRMANSYDCLGMSKPEWLRWFNRFRKNPDICPECHGQAQGWYKQHTGIIPCSEPHHYVGNFERNRKAFECGHFGQSYMPVMIQGDSRHLSEIIGRAECIVGSPPYSPEALGHAGKGNEIDEKKRLYSRISSNQYGETEGQLSAMKPGSVDAVVSSPPYAQHLDAKNSDGIDWSKCSDGLGGIRDFSKEPGQKIRKNMGVRYSDTPGNLGNLKPGEVDAVVSSPPYEEGIGHGGTPTELDKKKALYITDSNRYSESNENLGNQRGDTFWQAAKQIVSECHKILKPQGIAIWVVKAFVRKGKLVDFPADWQRLCEAQGFQTLCLHHAMLVKQSTHSGLFEDITIKKERKSFFRRLAEAKGSPPIDFETVICMRKTS